MGVTRSFDKWKTKAGEVDAVQWFKNGDHPLDYSKTRFGYRDGELVKFSPEEARDKEWEGDVVRYFRHPEVPGERACPLCGRRVNDHGWIDEGSGGQTVCPGDWVVTAADGSFFVMRARAFEATYEPVD